MLRYAGKLSGLYPKNVKDALKVDMIVDALEQVFNTLYGDKTKEGREKFVQEVLPQFFDTIDKLYGESKGSFLLGNHVCIADLKLMCTLEGLNEGEQYEHVAAGVLDKYTHVIAARKAVVEHAKVKAWYAKKDGEEVKKDGEEVKKGGEEAKKDGDEAKKEEKTPRPTFFSKVFKRRGKRVRRLRPRRGKKLRPRKVRKLRPRRVRRLRPRKVGRLKLRQLNKSRHSKLRYYLSFASSAEFILWCAF